VLCQRKRSVDGWQRDIATARLSALLCPDLTGGTDNGRISPNLIPTPDSPTAISAQPRPLICFVSMR
jgi:hypothetical protein